MHLAMVTEPRLLADEETDRAAASLPMKPGGFWAEAAPGRSPSDHDWDLARDALEDIGTLRATRRPRGPETWDKPVREERRFFAQLDAVLAAGPEVLERACNSVLGESIVPPDPEWIFAVTLALACRRSAASAGQLVRIFRHCCAGEPAGVDAVVEALSLAPEGAIPESLAALLTTGDRTEAAATAQLLGARGELDEPAALVLLRSNDPVLMAAALETAWDRGFAPVLAEIPRLYAHTDPAVAGAALRAGFAANLAGTRRHALGLCHDKPEFAGAVACLALLGDRADHDLFRRLCAETKSAAVLSACGIWGYPEIVPGLLSRMREAEDPGWSTAAEAFERITGSGLWRPPDSDEEPGNAVEVFENWWSERADSFMPGVRYRRGNLIEPEALIHELEECPIGAAPRALVHLELAARSTLPPPHFRPWDFIARQRAGIRAWRERFSLIKD